jgi:hypothetical protein
MMNDTMSLAGENGLGYAIGIASRPSELPRSGLVQPPLCIEVNYV